jgi:hypothetical protein
MTFGSSALLFLLSVAVGLPADVGKGLAALPPLGIKSIYDFLEMQSAKHTLAHAKSIVSFEGFTMHPLSAFILATTMYIGVIAVTSTLAGFLVGVVVPHNSELWRSQINILFNIFSTTAVPLHIIGITYIGYWIGHRSHLFVGLAVAIGSLVVGQTANSLIASRALPLLLAPVFSGKISGQFEAAVTTVKSMGLWTVVLGSPFDRAELALLIIVVSLGVWWAQRGRLTRYLAFILKILPEETRQAIVEIARDEALRAPIGPEALRA